MEVVLIADQVIVGLFLPEGTGFTQLLVCLLGGEGLPTVENPGEVVAFQGPDHHVNVIGHDAPGD